MINIFVFTSIGSLQLKCDESEIIQSVLDRASAEFRPKGLPENLVEARLENAKIISNDTKVGNLGSNSALLLLTKPETMSLPPVARTFFSPEAMGELGNLLKFTDSDVDEDTQKQLNDLKQKMFNRFSQLGVATSRKDVRHSRMPLEKEKAGEDDDSKRLKRLSALWDQLTVETKDAGDQLHSEESIKNLLHASKTNSRLSMLMDSSKRNSANQLGESKRNSSMNMLAESKRESSMNLSGESKRNSSMNLINEEKRRSKIALADERKEVAPAPAPPPPPPPMMSAPPPPPMMPGPPPPPPGNGPPPPPFNGIPAASAAPAPKPAGDMQSELMNMLKDPNLRKKLKKSTPKPKEEPNQEISNAGITDEERKARDEKALKDNKEKMAEHIAIERQNLLIELLGYMETPNGSIDDLLTAANQHTGNCRTFIYTLIRNKWLKGFRLKVDIDESQIKRKKKFVPCTVYRGREWTSAIEVPDKSREELDQIPPEDYVLTAHMYRFDQTIQEHVLDQIVLYKDEKFPPKMVPFNRPEPPQDNSLENRKKWEIWHRKRMEHQQSDSAQYDLIFNKLLTFDVSLTQVFEQMQETILQIRKMNDVVSDTFKDTPIEELREVVKSIPEQIKNVARMIHQTNGIIIKDTDLKLTPAFLKSLSSNPNLINTVDVKPTPAANEGSKESLNDKRRNNRESMVHFAGLPMEKVLPLLQSYNSRKEGVDEKKAKRFTLW